MKYVLFFFSFFLATALSANEVDRLLDEYRQIGTVSCQIRRTVGSQAENVQFISRVYWQSGDRLHVENLTPIPRRIIADGSNFFSYAEGDPKGFRRPIGALSEEMLLSLRKIPGTAMDHLLRLNGLSENALEPVRGMRRTAYQTKNHYVVLQFDESDRLAEIDFFETSEMTTKTASYRYSSFLEAIKGVWIPLLQESSLSMKDGQPISETVQIDRFIANQPLAVSLFNPTVFFDRGVDFVDSFDRIYGD